MLPPVPNPLVDRCLTHGTLYPRCPFGQESHYRLWICARGAEHVEFPMGPSKDLAPVEGLCLRQPLLNLPECPSVTIYRNHPATARVRV